MSKIEQKETKEEVYSIKEYINQFGGRYTSREKFAFNLSFQKESPKTIDEWKKLLV